MGETTHLTAEDTRRSLCGVKDALPIVHVRHAAAHVEGHGMVVCVACEQATNGRRAMTVAEVAALVPPSVTDIGRPS